VILSRLDLMACVKELGGGLESTPQTNFVEKAGGVEKTVGGFNPHTPRQLNPCPSGETMCQTRKRFSGARTYFTMGSDFALPGGTKYIEFFVCLFVVTFFDDKKWGTTSPSTEVVLILLDRGRFVVVHTRATSFNFVSRPLGGAITGCRSWKCGKRLFFATQERYHKPMQTKFGKQVFIGGLLQYTANWAMIGSGVGIYTTSWISGWSALCIQLLQRRIAA